MTDPKPQECNMGGLCKRNEFRPTSSLLDLLQGLLGCQHQHDFMTVISRPTYDAAGVVMRSDGVESLSGRTSGLDINDDFKRSATFMAHNDEPPSAPQIHSKGVIATDITQQFMSATKRLDIGQLVKDDYFTLFESVGAIEIMDPKMDTGYLAEGETMDDDYDVTRNLLPEELLGIIDQLLCLEMAWHMGHPLSQTIFTSLYIDKILNSKRVTLDDIRFGKISDASHDEPLNSRVLRAYCLGLLMTCSHVNNRVKSEHFYEEEDFVTHTYNRNLLEDIPDSAVISCLKDTQNTLSKSKKASGELINSLCMRLKFRIALVTAVSLADQRDMTLSKEAWDTLIALLPGVSISHELSKPVTDAFSVKLQRKLASTVPPRPVVSIAFDAACKHLERLCLDGRALTEILDYHDSHSLMTFVTLFQTRKPQPTVYIRTLLQFYIFGDMMVLSKMSIRQLLDDDLSSLVLAEDPLLDARNDEIEVPHDPRFNMAKRMEIFRDRAAHSYLDILRTLCQNRCRTRRDLTHTIIDWENLQLDAEELDQELREYTGEEPVLDDSISPDPIYSFPLSSWAYFYKLRQMEWIVQVGFELEVYQVDELAGMYWYLQHLTQTRIRHTERIRGFTMRRFTASGQAQSTPSQKDLGFGRALSYINYSMLEATATQGFADALSCLYTVLGRHKLIPTPPRPYSDDALRYELRMKPFLPIGLPEFISHEQFQLAVSQADDSTADLLGFATEAVARTRKDFELLSKLDGKTARCMGSEEAWKKNVKDCLRACISASISISVVKKALEKAGAAGKELDVKVEVPPVGEGYHDWWIVPKIVVLK